MRRVTITWRKFQRPSPRRSKRTKQQLCGLAHPTPRHRVPHNKSKLDGSLLPRVCLGTRPPPPLSPGLCPSPCPCRTRKKSKPPSCLTSSSLKTQTLQKRGRWPSFPFPAACLTVPRPKTGKGEMERNYTKSESGPEGLTWGRTC